jgi:hypothetical protein
LRKKVRADPSTEQLRGDVVAREIGGAEIAEGDLGGFVAGLAHRLGETGAGGLAEVAQPDIEGSGGTKTRLGGIGMHRDALAGAVLVGLRTADHQEQAAAE